MTPIEPRRRCGERTWAAAAQARALEEQKQALEAQQREIDDLRKLLDDTQKLSLSSHSRREEMANAAPAPSR